MIMQIDIIMFMIINIKIILTCRKKLGCEEASADEEAGLVGFRLLMGGEREYPVSLLQVTDGIGTTRPQPQTCCKLVLLIS